MSLISTRVPEDLDKELDWYAKKEKLGKTIALRKVIDKGLKDIKLEYALEQYQKGKITVWKAADVAAISLWEMLEIIKERRIPSPYTTKDVEEDIKAALAT
tara:strand:- start:85 stop:387 length:303 start_codon:yes stop_codon:yes gene_type:complete